MPTKIIQCTCKHEYQDKQYGPKKRVHNRTGRTLQEFKWRCTVCSEIKPNQG